MTESVVTENDHPLRTVCICITGGIAAFKVAGLVSQLAQSNWNVTVVMTPAATKFVGETTFQSLSGKPVITSVFGDADAPFGAHVKVCNECELLLIAPATADFIAKAAVGISDCVASTTYLAFGGTVLVAPAMNSVMWNKPATQRNVQQLREDGVIFVGPEDGWLSCRQSGPGRLVNDRCLINALKDHYPQ